MSVTLSLNQESILDVTAKSLSTGVPMRVQMVARAPVSAEDIGLEPIPLDPAAQVQAEGAATPELEVSPEVAAQAVVNEKAKGRIKRFSGLRSFIRRITD